MPIMFSNVAQTVGGGLTDKLHTCHACTTPYQATLSHQATQFQHVHQNVTHGKTDSSFICGFVIPEKTSADQHLILLAVLDRQSCQQEDVTGL